jgi:zinc transport system substrate-binding protein
MKKLVLSLMLVVFACIASAAQEKKLKIITTIFPQYDFIREIAKDKVELVQLLPLGAESHSFEPAPKDIIRIRNCDMFVYVGGESDEWIKKILTSQDIDPKKTIALINLVKPLEEEIVEGMQEEEEEGEEEGEEKEYDEHVWTSPKNAVIIIEALLNYLKQADSKNADFYEKNAKEYIKRLESLDAEFEEIVKNAKRNAIVFADRFPLRYFADRYGLKYFAAFPGCSSETEASAGTIKFLIDKIKSENIPVVFHIEFSNEKMANAVSEATKAKKELFHSCHNLSKKDFKNGVGYADLMQRNAKALKEALN